MSDRKPLVYPYIPNSVPEVKARMLDAVGAASMDELFAEVPSDLRLDRPLDLPEPIVDEYSIRRHVEELLEKNGHGQKQVSFLGAGCARHFVPAVCDEIAGRGEFLTAYSADPYADHGKWQAYFEANSMIAELLDMDVVGGPMYDAAQAAATSLRIASRLTGRRRVILPRHLNPQVRAVVENYARGVTGDALDLVFVDYDPDSGLLDLADLADKIGPDPAAVMIESPNYFGLIETGLEKIIRSAKTAGAEAVVLVDPVSLGVLAPPSNLGANIVCGDLHPLGLHQQCGGGQGGFIGVPGEMKYIGELKDKMYGLTGTAHPGELGFGHVLFDRTSFGSREKAKEFTGTGTGLWLIVAGVYLALMGPRGMAEVGETIMARAEYARLALADVAGVRTPQTGPVFKEFVVNFDRTGRTVAEINRRLLERGIFGGVDLSADFPELGQSALYCVTETITQADVDRLCAVLADVLGS
jgi:glycine dehydrogenase subunit 1